MHVPHLILVQAESHQDAIDYVWMSLNSDSEHFAADWSDWAVVGTEGFLESRFSLADDYDFTFTNKYVVSLETEEEAFVAVLSDFIGQRKLTFDRFKQEIANVEISELELDTPFSNENHDKAWKLSRLADLAWGNYTPDSAYYDLENNDTSLQQYEASLARGESNWYGVLVDFHL